MHFIYQANLNHTESVVFVSRNEDEKCVCFCFDREWRCSLVLVQFSLVIFLSPELSAWPFFHCVLQG